MFSKLSRFSRYSLAGAILGLVALVFLLSGHRPMATPSLPPLSGVRPVQAQQYPIPSEVHVPILTYHYVEIVTDQRDTIRKSLNIVPEIFTKQLETMKQAGYTFLFASDLADIMDGKKPLPAHPVMLTFDDGYRDFYTDVFPILEKEKVNATAYIVPGVLGKPNYMFPEQVATIVHSGLVEIGAHTVHHTNLKRAPAPIVQQEVSGSKDMLEKAYHIGVATFAYPYGGFDDQAVQLVKSAGFRLAVTTLSGSHHTQDTRFTLRRLRPGARTGQVLLDFLQK